MRISNLKPSFIAKCLRAYQPVGPFIYKEFVKDVQKIMFLARYFKQCKKKGQQSFKPAVIYNYYIGVRNCFGDKSNELLFEVADEHVWPDLLALMSFMKEIPEDGIINFSFGSVSIELYGTNTELLVGFRDEFKDRI